jgi:alanine racemase
MLYGSYPAAHFRSRIELRPVMRIETEILSLKRLPPGTPVSYSRSFITARESLIAVLPIGYGDGLPRSLSGKGEVVVRGVRAPMVGLICMDFVMCDVTDIEGVQAGDTAVILGGEGAETITAGELAEKAGTISYEIFCNITARVPRVYI